MICFYCLYVDRPSNPNYLFIGIQLFVTGKIAFQAFLTTDKIIHNNDNQVDVRVIFDEVRTNQGGAYNGRTGIFLAPVAGTYVFSLTFEIFSGTSHPKEGYLYLMKRGQIQLTLLADTHEQTGQNDMVTGTVVLALNAGDEIRVESYSDNLYIVGKHLTFFGGFLLG